MKHAIRKASGLMAALAVAGLSSAYATTTDNDVTLSAGQQKVATKFASPFATLAGSQENAVARANALRTGTPATLTYTTIVNGKPVTVTETITPPTKPMGWGNVSHALALAQFSLTQAGITQPTGAELQAALLGGKITTSDGKVVTLDGVLTQRASGMGWGQIARSEGTTMGAVNHGLKAPTTTITSSSGGPPNKIATPTGMTTASGAGSGSKGLTTAGGTPAGSNAGSKGLTTAGGTPASSHAGGPKGVVTASGSTSGSGIVTASGGQGGGNGAGHGVVSANGGGNGGGQSADHGKGKGGG